MNQLLEWLSKLFGSWKFWVVVPPWDVGVRVRLGRRAVALAPGPHWRVPFIDDVLLVNTRLRVATTPPVTIAGADGKGRIVTAAVGYRVSDPLLAMLRFENPSVAVQAYAQAEVAKIVDADACEKALGTEFETSGVRIEFVRYVEDVEVQTLRLLQNSWQLSSEQYIPATAPPIPRY